MGRTSIKNQLILSFLFLLLIVLTLIGVVNRMTNDFYLAQMVSVAGAMAAGIIFGNIFSNSLVRRLNSLCNVAREITNGDLSKDIPLLSQDEVRDLEDIFSKMVKDLRSVIGEMNSVAVEIQTTNSNLGKRVEKVTENSRDIDRSSQSIAKGSKGIPAAN